MEDQQKACKDCAEDIKLAAKKCRFCGAQYSDEELASIVSIADTNAAIEKAELISSGRLCPQCDGNNINFTYIEGYPTNVHWCYHCKQALEDMGIGDITISEEGSPGTGDIICSNSQCGYKGKPKLVRKGSTLLGVFMLFFFILPGVLYLMFTRGYHILCPQCNVRMA